MLKLFKSSKRLSLFAPFFMLILLAVCVGGIYGQFLRSPVVFDDIYFFDGSIHSEYLGKIFSLDLRWLPYATFEWTRALLGLDLIWFHLGNTVLHVCNTCLLYVFFKNLFQIVIPQKNIFDSNVNAQLSVEWTAFFSALIFALHPVAVYAVTYLSQRSLLMATCFVLVMLNFALIGIQRQNNRYLFASAVAYFFAVLSKEHAIMAPAVVLALFFLIGKPSKEKLNRILPVFILYLIIALLVVYQVKNRHILGQAYEVRGDAMLLRLADIRYGFDPTLAYPLSILTQSFLFFKYLLTWIVPSPAWMSVDMVQNFASGLFAWPYAASFIIFLAYPVVAIWLLLQGKERGLLGFAMIFPWLFFATEFSTVRIQESFVLYRSYLWMLGIFAALPFVLQKLSAKRSAIFAIVVIVFLIPVTLGRLTTFTHPLLLWDDAARLIDDKDVRPGVERIFVNRANQFYRLKMYEQALRDYDRALIVYPSFAYAYTGRGAVYFSEKKYQKALHDFNKAIDLDPKYSKSYLGLAKTYEAIGELDNAKLNYERLCSLGVSYGCDKK